MESTHAGELAGSSTPGTNGATTDAPKDAASEAERDKALSEFQVRYKQAKSHWKDWREEARNLYDFIAGRQWDEKDLAQLQEEQRPYVTFNIAGKYMDAITGLQINNRQEIRYFPRTNGAAKVNELMTGAVAWCRDLSNMIDEETDGFYDATLTGLGWMEGYIDKDLEPEGVAAGRRVDNMEMLPDPNARQRNLEDARFVIRERLMDHDEYAELFEGYADAVYDENPAVDDKANDLDTDTGIQVIPSPHDYGDSKGDTGERVTRGKCPVQDYQFWRREKRFVVTSQMGKRELTEDDYVAQKEALDALLAQGIPLKVDVISRKVYYRAYFSKGKMGPYGESPYQEGFTYHAITGKRDRNKRTWYGLGRAMIDSQNWTNKFFSTILYCLMVGAKGGILAEEDAFKDARKAESEWANPNSITWMKKGSLTGDSGPKVIPKPMAQYPQGLDRLMTFTVDSMPNILGLSPELLGMQDKVQSGVLEAQRKQSAMAIIAWAFDAMRRYYKSMGRQLARYVTDYMPEGMLVKINGPESAQYVPLLKNELALTFDVIVDEAPTSTNMRERVWAVIETLVPQLLQAGISIPPDVLDYSPLPTDLQQKWKDSLKPTPEKEMEKQLKVQGAQAEIGAKQAKANKDNADAERARAEINAPGANGTSEAMVKANADVQIAQMKGAIDARLEELKANRKAETEILIAQLKLENEKQIATLNAQIDMKIAAMNAESQEKIAKERPAPASKKD
jgi:hypothetical protein